MELPRFHHDRMGLWIHPNQMGEPEVEAFLTHLAVDRRVAESTQNQAIEHYSAKSPEPGEMAGALGRRVVGTTPLFVVFSSSPGAVVLGDPVPVPSRTAKGLGIAGCGPSPKRLPAVLSKEEVRRLFPAMAETAAHRLIVELPCGTGMRISECCQLRVCDLDFDRGQIFIRGGMGSKDRVTMLPQSLEGRLKVQVEFVRLRHQHDVEHGAGYAPVPTRLEHKRHGAAREVRRQFVVGSSVIRLDRESGRRIRRHAHPGAVARTIKQAAIVAQRGGTNLQDGLRSLRVVPEHLAPLDPIVHLLDQ